MAKAEYKSAIRSRRMIQRALVELLQEKELDNYNIIKGKYASEDFSVGVRKSDKTLKKKVNQAFKKLYKNGKFQAISQKWFG